MTIRSLRDDEPIPDSEPARYPSAAGYVRLRWLIGTDEYVEDYEHRVVCGRPAGLEIHHWNGDKSDNRRENLHPCTSAEHHRIHYERDLAAGRFRGRVIDLERAERKTELARRWSNIAVVYAAGYSTTQVGEWFGVHHSNISRGLRARGHVMRPAGRHG